VLESYAPIIGDGNVNDLRLIAQKLRGKVLRNINSTAVGGGVAEILNRLIPLMKELGIDARWDVVRGGDAFYGVTKKIHNALHGAAGDLTDEERKHFNEAQEANLATLDLNCDYMIIHDPQPAGLIKAKQSSGGKWVWRCHIDVSAPQPGVWGFLKPWVEQYDASVFSAPRFSQQLSIRQFQIAPSIDPLSDKNKDLPQSYIDEVLERFNLTKDKPLVTQVSRFDYLKDPVGVIEAYRMVKPYVDCQLLLVGGGASDDPEGAKVLAEVRERAGNDPDVHILELPPTSNLEINALQRASTIILQKSLKEGFGLTVSEALWKGKPVIAGAVGGIPLQITHKMSGILTRSIEGTAYWLKQLLQSPEFAQKLGENGREQVRDNFLLTRQLKEYMLLLLSLDHPGDIIYV
jgi:trehalose synthase